MAHRPDWHHDMKKNSGESIAIIINKKVFFFFFFIVLYERSLNSPNSEGSLVNRKHCFLNLDFKVHEALRIIATLPFVTTLYGPPREKHVFGISLRKCYDITGKKSSITEEKLPPDLSPFL